MPNPALATYRDGSYAAEFTCDPPYPETMDEHRVTIWHEPVCVDQGAYNPPALGASSIYGRFLRDTPWRTIGDSLIIFERLWHSIPSDWSRAVGVTKNYQSCIYNFSANPVFQDILSWSQVIKATCVQHYALDDPGVLPVLPFINLFTVGTTRAIDDRSTGFPKANINGQLLFSDNIAPSYISGSIEPVMGRLMCRKVITG